MIRPNAPAFPARLCDAGAAGQLAVLEEPCRAVREVVPPAPAALIHRELAVSLPRHRSPPDPATVLGTVGYVRPEPCHRERAAERLDIAHDDAEPRTRARERVIQIGHDLIAHVRLHRRAVSFRRGTQDLGSGQPRLEPGVRGGYV